MGRFGYFLVGGAAIFAGMVVQGDVDLGTDHDGHDRIVKSRDGADGEIDRATKRALASAVEELVRAEGSLISARMDDETPAAVIKQAEQRRDAAKQAVERLADDAKAESRGNRDALRQNIRDEIRDAVRS